MIDVIESIVGHSSCILQPRDCGPQFDYIAGFYGWNF